MTFLDVLQRWAIETLGLLLIVIPGGLLLYNLIIGNPINWKMYLILISFGGLLSGFKAIWNNVMRYLSK